MKEFIDILRIIAWPLVTLVLVIRFRSAIEALIPGARVKFKLAGIEVETTLKELTTFIQETYRHGELTDRQWEWLRRLKEEWETLYAHDKDYHDLRPLRNSGLIREHPEGWLSNCESVSITPLGEFLLKNKQA